MFEQAPKETHTRFTIAARRHEYIDRFATAIDDTLPVQYTRTQAPITLGLAVMLYVWRSLSLGLIEGLLCDKHNNAGRIVDVQQRTLRRPIQPAELMLQTEGQHAYRHDGDQPMVDLRHQVMGFDSLTQRSLSSQH